MSKEPTTDFRFLQVAKYLLDDIMIIKGDIMEAINLSSDRIKIIMSLSDMVSYDLCQSGNDDLSDFRGSSVRRILNDLGYDGGHPRLHVQAYSTNGGGCELYVTMLCEEEKQTPSFSTVLCEKAELEMLLTRLERSRFDGRVSMYSQDGSYFALLYGECPDFVGDYGSIKDNSCTPYIFEYGEKICLKETAFKAKTLICS